MTFIVVFTVEGIPQGKGRPRFRRAGNFVQTYTDAKTKSYEATIKDAAVKAMGLSRPLQSPVSVSLVIYLEIPKSWSKKKQSLAITNEILPIKKPDIDNVLKAFCDAMNGVVYVDDSQIVKMKATKCFGITPSVSVCVQEVL
jgi:Holliday junction resolvase RusA-like endonuclease